MKLGVIGEEMLATAVKLASEHDAEVQALHVIRVPLEQPLDAPMLDEDERAEASLAEAKLLGADFGVTVEGTTVTPSSSPSSFASASDASRPLVLVEHRRVERLLERHADHVQRLDRRRRARPRA